MTGQSMPLAFFYWSFWRAIYHMHDYKSKLNIILFKASTSFKLVWLVPLAQVWTHYKTGKLNMWTLFCNVCIEFLNSQIRKEIMLELNGKPSSVTTFSTDFSFQNLVFWIYLNFQQERSLKNHYLPHSESKTYQINSIKSCSSRSFQQHQRKIPIPPTFSATI
jgi:hypothetical protein